MSGAWYIFNDGQTPGVLIKIFRITHLHSHAFFAIESTTQQFSGQ